MLSTYTNAAGTLLKFYDLPSIDAPHAPLADALEVDEFSADITDECEYRAINGTIDESDTDMTAQKDESETSGVTDSDEEEMDQDEEGADFGLNDETLSDDGDEAISEDDEYPELCKNGSEAVVENDSYDFAVMDTEKDTNSGNRKRKAENSGVRAKKIAK